MIESNRSSQEFYYLMLSLLLKSQTPVAAPPADKKARMEKSDGFSLEAGLDTGMDNKPKTDVVRFTFTVLLSLFICYLCYGIKI